MSLKKLFVGFKTFKWFECVFLLTSLLSVLVVGIIFHSSVLTIISSLLGILAVFLSAKGMVLGCVVEIIQLFFFCTISWFNSYFGEVLVSAIIVFPSNVLSIIAWTRNLRKGTAIIKISNVPKLKEWILSILSVAVISVGMYFMLQAVGTASLIVSTINVALGMLSCYFRIRRCEYSFIFYILNNIISLVLWIQIMAGGDFSYTPTMMNYIIFMIMNIYGFFNWIKLKKLQKERKQRAENRIAQPTI